MKGSSRNIWLIISIIAIVVAVALGGLLTWSILSSNKAKDALEGEKNALQSELNAVGETVMAYTVVDKISSGVKILETHLTELPVPVSLAGNVVTDPSQIVGNYLKVPIESGTPITNDLITEFEIKDDLRLLDVITHSTPIGLESGDYVDVRIVMPNGADFIALPHRRVEDINSKVIKLVVNEEDIHIYNSLLIDTLLYSGSQIYAVEYLEGGVQQAASSYYPINSNVLAVAQKDPNLLTAIKSNILQKRLELEGDLSALKEEEWTPRELESILTTGRDRLNSVLTEAETEYNFRVDRETGGGLSGN